MILNFWFISSSWRINHVISASNLLWYLTLVVSCYSRSSVVFHAYSTCTFKFMITSFASSNFQEIFLYLFLSLSSSYNVIINSSSRFTSPLASSSYSYSYYFSYLKAMKRNLPNSFSESSFEFASDELMFLEINIFSLS